MTLTRIYHRADDGQVTTEDGKDWTKESLLASRPRLVYQETVDLLGWPDTGVDWYGITEDSASAIGFPRV